LNTTSLPPDLLAACAHIDLDTRYRGLVAELIVHRAAATIERLIHERAARRQRSRCNRLGPLSRAILAAGARGEDYALAHGTLPGTGLPADIDRCHLL
jgi:hypothetical protein